MYCPIPLSFKNTIKFGTIKENKSKGPTQGPQLLYW